MGRPQGLAPVIDQLPAVVTGYFGGPHQGAAIAEALFGVTIPPASCRNRYRVTSARCRSTTASGPAAGIGGPPPTCTAVTSICRPTPLFAFGHGLSYTSFDYGPLKLEHDAVDVGGELRLSLTVTNTGRRRGTEVVQLYAADTATGLTLPAQQLIGFTRVDLEPGAAKTVRFVVPMSLLAYTGLSGELVMEPGPVELGAGSSSSDLRSNATLTITGQTRTINAEERAFLSVATVGSKE